MITLFDQEQAVKDYIASEKRESNIQRTVQLCKYFGCSIEEATQKVAQDFKLSFDFASKRTQMYW